jgi:hypothetical protein
MLFSDVVNKVIDLARKVRQYYDAELPKRHRNYPLVGADEETAPPPPEEEKLKEFLESLPEDMIYQLLLIMYLGRGDFDADDFGAQFETRKHTIGDPEYAASVLMLYVTVLADELSDGLDELRKHGISLERMSSKKAKARKR